MPIITSPGVGSGLDIASIVESLVSADITPAQNRITLKQSNYTTQLSAVGQVKGILSKLQTTAAKLTDIGQFFSLKASSADTSVLSATASSTAQTGTYQVEVSQLAKSQSLASGAFASTSTVVGSGSISIEFGTYSVDLSTFTANPDKSAVNITIPSGQGTLEEIKNAINDSNAGVSAAIVQDSLGARLTLTSSETGEKFAMKISITDADANNTDNAGLSALAYDPTIAVTNLTETVKASDSSIKINGLTLTQSNNTYDNAITGLTINLHKANPGSTTNITVSEDKDLVQKAIDDFVKNYNETMTMLNNLTGYNQETQQGGLFQGDPAIRNLKFNLTRLIGEPIGSANKSLKSLADIGIKSNSNGILSVNSTDLNSALTDNYAEVGGLFAKNIQATDSNVRINGFSKSTRAGSYTLNIDSFTPGTTLTGTLGGLSFTSTNGKTINGSGNLSGLSLDVLGGSTGYRGKVVVTDGVAVMMEDLLDSYLASDGIIKSKDNALNDRLDDLSNQQLRLNDHATRLQQRYTAQFSRLDALLSSLQSLSSSLNQSLNNLPSAQRQRNN